jgi:GT2 family glycosyltransferase
LPKISVLVLNYNGLRFLDKCFQSLGELHYPDYEVILVDNASSDGSVAHVREKFPWVKLLVHEKNYGFCEGYNRSIASAQGEYLAFLNNDTRVDPDWLAELASAVQGDQADICGSKMLSLDNPEMIASRGGKITPIGSGYDIDFDSRDSKAEDNKLTFVGAVGSGAMLIRKATFLEIGGFDPDYFAGVEDLDLCWRAWLKGYKVIYVARSIVYHKVGGSWQSRRSSSRIFLGQKNRLANIVKNFECGNVMKGLALSLAYDLVRVVMFLARGEFRNILALAKGTLRFIQELPKTLRKRKTIQRDRRIPDKELYRLGLIAPLRDCINEFMRLEKRAHQVNPGAKGG